MLVVQRLGQVNPAVKEREDLPEPEGSGPLNLSAPPQG
jgi:hypothetical protein